MVESKLVTVVFSKYIIVFYIYKSYNLVYYHYVSLYKII